MDRRLDRTPFKNGRIFFTRADVLNTRAPILVSGLEASSINGYPL